jgi:hypothetical protein
MKRSFVSLVGAALLAGCSVVGIRSGYEGPSFTVVETLDENVEVRRYAPRLVAQTTVATPGADGRNEAFRHLFDYISGANEPASKVAMTVPVEVTEPGERIEMTTPVESARLDGDSVTMRFFLPASYSRSTAPTPTDPMVTLIELPQTTVAVLRFSGSRDERAVDTKVSELRRILAGSQWRPAGADSALFYDPPWTLPLFRRNEVLVPVAPKSS